MMFIFDVSICQKATQNNNKHFQEQCTIKITDNGPYRETEKVSAVERWHLFKFSVLYDILSVQKPYAMQQ